MLVLSEKLPYSRTALYASFGVLLLIAIFGGRVGTEVTAEATPDQEPSGALAPREEVVFDGVERDAVVGTRITQDRSFLYAPPPMPHDRKDVSQGDCLNCHAPVTNIAKKWRAIRPLAHEVYSQCLQCHVAQDRSVTDLFVESEFVGLDFPGEGSQAHEYAPPTIPHKVFMRENCLSCHGDTGYADFRTSHPERSQCMQCHVGELEADYTRLLK